MENRTSYEDFQKNLLNTVSQELNQQGRYQCELTQTAKNNVTLTGIVIRQEGSMTAPVFYLDHAYQQYLQGKPLNQIGQDLITYYQKIDVPVFEEQDITDYEKMKDRLRVRLVNKENNKGFYKQGPYRMQPLGAEVLYAELQRSEEGSLSVHLTNAIAENWGIPKQELFAAALEHTQEHNKVSFVPMGDIIRELLTDEKVEEETEGYMYVLTNERREHGAIVTSYPGVLEQVREQLGGDFYILPSSTHEVIILQKEFGMDPREMRSMVREINAEMVEPQEILSNEVYEFQGKTNKVKNCIKEERER
ncbi:MAG: DUF5688 family protein [Clostridium sp.]